MDLTPVTSSAVTGIGYDEANRELHVQFKGGRIYTYVNVAPETHSALMSADSIGNHFATVVKPNHQVKP